MSLPVAVSLKRLATDFFVFCMEMNAPPAFVGARDVMSSTRDREVMADSMATARKLMSAGSGKHDAKNPSLMPRDPFQALASPPFYSQVN